MADIIENEEIDRNTVDDEELQKQFSLPYKLITETSVSLKKSFINRIHGTKSLKLAVSVSDNSIEVYQLTNTSLTKLCRLSGHGKAVSDVVFSPKEDYLLYSSGQDGVLKLWDTRTSGSCVQEYKDEEDTILKPYDCMDVSCNGRVLCAGSQLVQDDAFLVFYEPRQSKPLGGYWSSHTDDISQVRFHPTKPALLATGALDNLVNIFNVLEATEDDALLYSLNVENSVERLTWLDDTCVACVTQSNDLQLWDGDTGDLVKSYSREKVAKGIRRSRADDCYLVDTFTTSDGASVLLAGSHAANGEILRSATIGDKRLQPRTDYKHNKQTVCCCWHHKERDILVTAGESGIISVYESTDSEADPAPNKLLSKLDKLHVNRHRPY